MANDTELAQELKALKERIQILEDKEAIRDVITRYAFNADLNRIDSLLELWTDDCTFNSDRGRVTIYKGKDEIEAYLREPLHQSITNRSQHLQLDYIIKVDGDTATATGYQLLTLRWDGGFGIIRGAFRVFHLRRVNGTWLIRRH